jgi:hypothetical protein
MGKICSKHVELILEINKLLLLHLVDFLYYFPYIDDARSNTNQVTIYHLTRCNIPEDFILQHCWDKRTRKILCQKTKLWEIMQKEVIFLVFLTSNLLQTTVNALLAPTVLHIIPSNWRTPRHDSATATCHLWRWKPNSKKRSHSTVLQLHKF